MAKSTLSTNEVPSNKSAITALLLCLFLGSLGIHRFYVGRWKTGILMLLTLGGLGIWTLVDIIMIACCNFTDKNGKYLMFARGKTSPRKTVFIVIGSVLGAFLVMVAAIVSLALYMTSPTVNSVQAQLAALRAGDMDKAYSYMSEETRRDVSLQDFKTYMANYPAMQKNIKASFPERRFENDQGYIKANLVMEDGSKVEVEYLMKYEDGVWKIFALRVNEPEETPAADPASGDVKKAPENDTSTSSSESAQKGFRSFSDRYGKFSINYPANWYYEQPHRGAVIFSGAKGSPSYYSTVSIQVIPSKAAGGVYVDTKAAIEDLKNQIRSQAKNVKFLDSGDIGLPMNPDKVHGQYFVVLYSFKGHNMKKMQFVLIKEGGKLLYSYGYTSPVAQYDKDYAVDKAMYESWKID